MQIVSVPEPTESNGWCLVSEEVESCGKESALSWSIYDPPPPGKFSGRTEKTREKHQFGNPLSLPKFEMIAVRILLHMLTTAPAYIVYPSNAGVKSRWTYSSTSPYVFINTRINSAVCSRGCSVSYRWSYVILNCDIAQYFAATSPT
jgi:hypothetical protein